MPKFQSARQKRQNLKGLSLSNYACNSKAWTTSFYIALGLAEALCVCVCVCVFTALFHPNFEREIKLEQRKETNIPEPSSTTCKERPELCKWMVW
jgi:hypothetical protein